MNGSGKIIEQDLKLKDFDTINIHGPFILDITQNTTFNVTLIIDDNLINRVRGSLDRKTLMLSIEAPATFFPTSLKVKISMPRISGLSLSEDAKANMSGFRSFYDFNLYLNKGSSLNGSMEAGNITINLSGSSQALMFGKAETLDLQCSGGSKIDLNNFVVNSAHIKMNETSQAALNVIGELDVIMNDASKIYYQGNPLISDSSISGGSTMIRN